MWIKTKINSTITFEPSTIILGYLNNDNRSIPLNTIILITKSYIFWCSRKKNKPNIFSLQKRIQETYNNQNMVARLNNKYDQFQKSWKAFEKLIN